MEMDTGVSLLRTAQSLLTGRSILVSDGCFVLSLIPYCIILVHFLTIDWVLFRYTHANLCSTDLICGLVLIFLCGLLSVYDDTNCS